jgi:acyl-CoA reductase-like NAD-dependent aldehyde dehydrogenase
MNNTTTLPEKTETETGHSLRHYPLLIDNRDIYTSIQRTFVTVSDRLMNIDVPIASYSVANRSENVLAVNAAKKAFKEYKNVPVKERLEVISTLRSLLLANKAELHDVGIAEGISSKAMEWQLDIILNVILSEENFDFYEYLARPFDKLKKDEAYILRQPLGVLGIITPFNAAILLAGLGIMSQLISGNTSVIKAPSTNPISTLLFGQLVNKALMLNNMPSGVINVIVGDGKDVSDEWIENRLIEGLVFYGGSGVGLKVGTKCIKKGIKPILELAGSDACVVWEDADLDAAAENIVKGRFTASGQVCISIKRLFVHEKVHDELVERIIFHTRKLKVGLPSDPQTDIIPLGHEETLIMISAAIEKAVMQGAKVICGGYRVNWKEEKDVYGHYFTPTVITDSTSDMDIMQNEILGPVLPVAKFNSIEQAIKMVNDSKFGLRASIWAKDRSVIDRFIEESEVGGVLVNRFHLWFGDDVAHLGGLKASSGTNTGAKYFIEEMLKKKYVNDPI